jgi:DNA-binding transcriptional ArsR family regulator
MSTGRPSAPYHAVVPSQQRRAATPEETRALAHPLRLRIIRLLYDGPLTNGELAHRLGERPATVLYHVRTLAGTGFITAEPARPGRRGTVEKPYRSTGKSWEISVEVPDRRHRVSQASIEAFLAEVDELRDHEPEAEVETSRLAVDLSPDRRAELTERLSALLDEVAGWSEPGRPGRERWSIFLALNPRPAAATAPSPSRRVRSRAQQPGATAVASQAHAARLDSSAGGPTTAHRRRARGAGGGAP